MFVFGRQLCTLLRKNAILKTRTAVEWACEVLIPIAFVGIIALVFSLFNQQVSAARWMRMHICPFLAFSPGDSFV